MGELSHGSRSNQDVGRRVNSVELHGFGLIQSKFKSNPFNLDLDLILILSLDWIGFWIQSISWIWTWIWI